MRILVVCGAGASSTFVAQRILRSAARRAITITVTPSSEALLGSLIPGADVILVGSHLAARIEDIRPSAGSVPVVALPDSAFTAVSGDAALDLALSAAQATQ
ncbi:PTS sugar transporter subunit IIB [Luethyella okanaganae]|uniref:PTS sugar transporter subunit IIB n=1 Tax=Luethyella okanaganae TaxID=69372 RepID=A0ABW1VF63_9MICO